MTDALGFYASVGLEPLRAPHAAERLARRILSTPEYEHWSTRPSQRRRLSYLGGRYAAKLAAARLCAGLGRSVPELAAIQLAAARTGHRFVAGLGTLRPVLSLTHTARRAVAVIALEHAFFGIDSEDSFHAARICEPFFHPLECSSIASPEDARLRWTVKEAVGKLFGTGLSGNSYLTHRLGPLLLVTSPYSSRHTLNIAANRSGCLAYMRCR